MRVSSKGQVTIPLDIRRSLGILPNAEVIFLIRNNEVVIRKQEGNPSKRSMQFIKQLSGKASIKMSTDEILALTRS